MNFVVTQRFAGRGHQEEAGPEGAPGARHLREQALPPLRAQHTGQPADRGCRSGLFGRSLIQCLNKARKRILSKHPD